MLYKFLCKFPKFNNRAAAVALLLASAPQSLWVRIGHFH